MDGSAATPVALPVVLVDTADAVASARVVVETAGFTVEDGWAAPDQPWDLAPLRLVRAGVAAADGSDHHEIVRLATRGVGLLLALDDAPTRARLVDALRRARPVVDWRSSAMLLSPTQVRLLLALADGATMPRAAQGCHLSTRSAYREVAAARTTLATATTTEAASVISDLLQVWRDAE